MAENEQDLGRSRAGSASEPSYYEMLDRLEEGRRQRGAFIRPAPPEVMKITMGPVQDPGGPTPEIDKQLQRLEERRKASGPFIKRAHPE